MILLSNPLLTPDLGLIFWTTVFFFILWFLLGRSAWRPIVNALKARETKIASALNEAKKAREEMAMLQSEHQKLLIQAKEERAAILKEAKQIREQIIAEAREKAQKEYAEKVASAKDEIYNQKMAAVIEVKNLIGSSAVDLAKQVLTRELSNRKDQEAFIAKQIKTISL